MAVSPPFAATVAQRACGPKQAKSKEKRGRGDDVSRGAELPRASPWRAETKAADLASSPAGLAQGWHSEEEQGRAEARAR
jgi:hypothetical protein